MAISRREFVVRGTAAGAGLLIGVRLAGATAYAAQEDAPGAKKAPPNPFVAYMHVKPDGQISLIVAKSEMGQGIKTGLAMILAEEACVDFETVMWSRRRRALTSMRTWVPAAAVARWRTSCRCGVPEPACAS